MPKTGTTKGDVYLFDSKFSDKELTKIAEALTNPILEEYFINESPRVEDFSYAIEIGYLPGVTDNVGHTVKEMVTDLLKLRNPDFQVYTSNHKLYRSKIMIFLNHSGGRSSWPL